MSFKVENRFQELLDNQYDCRNYKPGDRALNALGYSKKMFGRFLNNTSQPDLNGFIHICEYYGWTLDTAIRKTKRSHKQVRKDYKQRQEVEKAKSEIKLKLA